MVDTTTMAKEKPTLSLTMVDTITMVKEKLTLSLFMAWWISSPMQKGS